MALTLEAAGIVGERIANLEAVSALRALADKAEGDVAAGIYRNLIELFENRATAAAIRLEQATKP